MRNIALIGMPATGKSAVGRRLALTLGLPFFDTDEMIESREDASIAEIFEARGEAYFRTLEQAVISEVTGQPGVVATGGGVVERPENMTTLREWGWIIALVAPPEVLARRVGRADQWPLLRGGVLENLERLWKRREAGYRAADLVVDVAEEDVDEVVRRILNFLAEREPTAIVTVRPRLAPPYRAIVGEGVRGLVGCYAQEAGLQGRAAVLVSPAAARSSGILLCDALQGAGFSPVLIEIPAGESAKTWESVGWLCDRLVQEQLDRTGCLVAMGGEETLDIGGFLAATYMRGIPSVYLPTTLVAQLDSCIGGKVSLNHPRAKNLIGLLHHPRLAVVDVQLARAGGTRAIRAGLAEAVKYGVIADAGLFRFLEERAGDLLRGEGLAELVAWCLRIKAGIVDEDEEGTGRRMLLNYGHTFAHAIEASTGFRRYTHGEAVAIGMTLAARVGSAMGITAGSLEDRQTALLRRLGLPCDFSGVATAHLVEALWRDKKKQGARLRFVLPTDLGGGEVRSDVPIDLVARVLSAHGAAAGRADRDVSAPQS